MNFTKSFKEIKNHLFKKENLINFTIVAAIFFLDRFSKLSVLKNFNESNYYINNFFNIDLTWNTGIGFGLLSTNLTLYYNLITFVIGLVILILVYILMISENVDKFVFSFIVGGALGNFYDRLIYKAVPDFIDLHYNNFHWFVFNVADIFISIGIIAYIIKGYFEKN